MPLLGYEKYGHGAERVVLMHELLGDHKNWDPILPYLNFERCTYVFPDFRGYGLSRDLVGSYSLEETANDVMDLADALGFTRLHVVGHSMSGMIAQWIAIRWPSRVKSVVAIAPVPASGFKTDAAGLDRLLAIADDDQLAYDAIAARTGNRYSVGWLARKLTIARAAATREAMHGYIRMFTKADFSSEACGLETPFLCIVGAHDIPLYREESVRATLGKWYSNFEVVVCREAGHYPMLEAPVFTASQIDRAVAAHAA